jgi:nucleotide-binding universal stress UspA family protein
VAGLHADRPDLVVETDVKQGHPVDVLVNATRHAGLLVLGSRGRGPIRSVLLGSVSREVAQRARCSVLVVRPAPRHSNVPDQTHESHTAWALL